MLIIPLMPSVNQKYISAMSGPNYIWREQIETDPIDLGSDYSLTGSIV